MTHWSDNPIIKAIIAGSVREALKLQDDHAIETERQMGGDATESDTRGEN